jgi:type II secretory pathway component PulJ
MARREGLTSSLFPFMSVLACTIGALVVLLAIQSLSAVETTKAAQRAGERLRSESRSVGEALARDERRLAQAEERWAELDAFLAARGIDEELDAFELVRRVERARRIQATRLALAELRSEAESIARQRGEVEASIEVLAARRESLPILIDPTGLSRRWRPFFVECDAEGATAHRGEDDVRYFVARDEVDLTGDFGRYLRRVRAESGALLVLLVRSDGLRTARRVESVAEGAGVRVARLPLPGDGALDWSMLARIASENQRP